MSDFRSDTVTKPTKKMYEAMMNAPLGDDVYQDDPTVIKLEEMAARMLGKEAALFVPSGTFANQLAIMTHTKRGDEIICIEGAHIKKYEAGAIGGLSGVNVHSIKGKLGYMEVADIENSIRGEDVHFPDTALICIENAYNGVALSLEYLEKVYNISSKRSIPMHLDGARIFNASVSLGVDVKEISKYFESISVCLSKGLCAPIGSILVSDRKFIERARRYRKMLGGGMRQVGIIAAAGIVALEDMTKRLSEDHENARYLALELDKFSCINIIKDRLDINMVFFDMDHPIKHNLHKLLEEKGILINGYYKDGFRFACHNDITREDIDYLISTLESILNK